MNCPKCSGKPANSAKINSIISAIAVIHAPKHSSPTRHKSALIVGIHRDAILNWLNIVSACCERVMEEKIKGVKVGYIEFDDISGYVQKKEEHKETAKDPFRTIPSSSGQMPVCTVQTLICTYKRKPARYKCKFAQHKRKLTAYKYTSARYKCQIIRKKSSLKGANANLLEETSDLQGANANLLEIRDFSTQES